MRRSSSSIRSPTCVRRRQRSRPEARCSPALRAPTTRPATVGGSRRSWSRAPCASTNTASIAKRMKNMWIEGERSIQRPSPAARLERPSRPTVRSRSELATRPRIASAACRLVLLMDTDLIWTDRSLRVGGMRPVSIAANRLQGAPQGGPITVGHSTAALVHLRAHAPKHPGGSPAQVPCRPRLVLSARTVDRGVRDPCASVDSCAAPGGRFRPSALLLHSGHQCRSRGCRLWDRAPERSVRHQGAGASRNQRSISNGRGCSRDNGRMHASRLRHGVYRVDSE